MLALTLTFVSWSGLWIFILFCTPEGGLQTKPTDKQTLQILTLYHVITTPLLLVFYYRNCPRLKQIRLKTFEQKGFFIIGVIAALANCGVNVLSSTFGPRNMILFVACTIQNTLLYIAIVGYICLIDTWDMNTASFNDKLRVILLFSAQVIINVAQVAITIGHYLYAASDEDSKVSSVEAVLDSLYRSW